MIAAWAVYTILLSVILALAARAGEEVLETWRLPTRWVWAAAAVGSVVVPAVLRWEVVAPVERSVGALLGAGTAASGAAGLSGIGAAAPPAPAAWSLLPAVPTAVETALMAAWAVASLALAAGAFRVWRKIDRGRARWPRRRIDGVEVLVAPGTGPAVTGLLDPVIVLPREVLGLPARERRLVVRHEREHREARDPLLLAAGLAAVVACPWNPVLWWTTRRLRLAVERDCDRRVLDGGADPDVYGTLLLTRAGGRGATPLPAAALGGGRSHLERRLRAMTSGVPRFRILRSAAAAVVAAGLAVAACDTPVPPANAPDGDVAAERAAAGPEAPGADAAAGHASPEADGTVRIRGNGSVDLTVNPPLIFVDGERVTGPTAPVLDDLAPDDIASIEVMKGAEATARYGEEGRDGVILITRKGGR